MYQELTINALTSEAKIASQQYGCSFCTTLNDENPPLFNTPLLETTNFKILPSLGAFMPGWFLIVSKTHYLSSGNFPPSLAEESRVLIDLVRTALREACGKSLIFEHGPSIYGSPTGCSVDHAHTHVLPADADLELILTKYIPPDVRWRTESNGDRAAAFARNVDFLYYERNGGNRRIAESRNFTSQLFRKALHEVLKVDGSYNWRVDRREANAAATIALWRSLSLTPTVVLNALNRIS